MCSKACYPPGARREGGDWSSRDPVCASGITYMNRAEAMVILLLYSTMRYLVGSE